MKTERSTVEITGREIDWDSYASQYDLLATNNPSYHENIGLLRDFLAKEQLPPNAKICDVGAGTGNFICALAVDYPDANFTHIDADELMNRIASQKFDDAGVANVEVVHRSAHDAEFAEATFDVILSINAIYAMPPQRAVLERVFRWLKPGGVFFVIDFGRQMQIWDWSKYFIGTAYREKGLIACLAFVSRSFHSFFQNRRGAKIQANGTYWLHTTEQFQAVLEDIGFNVEAARPCYRGYSDLAICRKPVALVDDVPRDRLSDLARDGR